MKVLFILDPFQVEPLGVGYLASALKQARIEVDWLKSDDPELFDNIIASSPNVLAYSITTGKHGKFISLNRQIRNRFWAASIFGGSHPTYFPEMIDECGVDVIIRGEADHSLIEHLDNRKLGIVDFHPLEQNLDSLPFPDREFLYKYPENRDNPIKNVITSRGCRFNCPYCFNSIYRNFYRGQQWVRYRSPENVIAECLELKQYPLKMIYFQDDEFISNPQFFELLELYRRHVRVPYHCQIRIELLSDVVAYHLKASGCCGVTFAIESGNDYIRRHVLGRRMNREAILKGAEILHRHGIKFRIENMVGLPGEGVKEMLDTLDLNIRCHPTYGWASIFQPYPKLPLTEYAEKLGLYDSSVDNFRETFFEGTVLNTPIKSKIVNFQRLFGLAVSFPILRKAIQWGIKLPNNALYVKLSAWWKRRQFRRLYSEAYE